MQKLGKSHDKCVGADDTRTDREDVDAVAVEAGGRGGDNVVRPALAFSVGGSYGWVVANLHNKHASCIATGLTMLYSMMHERSSWLHLVAQTQCRKQPLKSAHPVPTLDSQAGEQRLAFDVGTASRAFAGQCIQASVRTERQAGHTWVSNGCLMA